MLAAQAFTSLIPFLVVAAAFGPGEGDEALFNDAGEVTGAVTRLTGQLAVGMARSSPLRNTLADVGGVVFAIALSTVFGFVVWLATPAILLGARDWRRLFRRRSSPRRWARCSGRRRASTFRYCSPGRRIDTAWSARRYRSVLESWPSATPSTR